MTYSRQITYTVGREIEKRSIVRVAPRALPITIKPAHTTASQLKLSQKTVIDGDLFHSLREVCSKKLCDIDTRLGGPGCVVEIDESLFRAKCKVNK